MTYQDPHDLLDRWETNPRAITMDEVIRQMLQLLCGMYERQNEQEEKHTRQINLMERGTKAFIEQTRQQIEMFQSDLKALEQAVVALEKATETRSEEIEESISKDLTEILDAHIQMVQQDILEFQARFQANEEEIRLLQKELKGMHPTAELFILELATAFNTLNRLMARSQQTAFVLGGRRADLFQKRADAEDVKQDTEGKANDIPPDKSSQE